ncbi:MAG: T9SS type A sorting domain-containing protein [Pirellulales bacterium]
MPDQTASSQPLPWSQEQKLTADDAVAGIGFGDSGALGDGVALIGATATGLANLSAGAVYVLKWNESEGMWQHATKLTADDGELDDRFGWSVAISGDAAVIGAPDVGGVGAKSGAAYVFRRVDGAWQQEQKLSADDAPAGDRFGRSVSVSGDVAVVGAPDADGDGGPTGAAYVFRWDGTAWQQEQKLQVGSFATIASFGASVAALGDRLLIGVPRAGPGAQNLGAAYVFRWDSTEAKWLDEQRLSASDENPQDMFGSSVALSDSIALIGVPADEDGGSAAGAAYVFRWDGETWQEEQKLLADDADAGDRFGDAVALSGDVAVVGSPNDDNDGGLSAGGSYIFEWNGASWDQTTKLTADDSGIGDHFGESVAVGGDRILVGASNNDDGGESAGSAYVFSRGATETAVEDVPEPSSQLALLTYPNPFRQRAILSYELSRSGWVRLAVYDILGRQVMQPVDEQRPAGSHTFVFDVRTLPPGVYFARVETANEVATSRMVHME